MDARLLLLLDSRAPAGAHHHSAGMEAAIEAGMVRTESDVARFCRTRLHTSGQVAATFAAAACLAWHCEAPVRHWNLLDAELDARTPSEAQRAASRALGRGLLRLARATVPGIDSDTPFARHASAPHHALAVGAAVAACGADAHVAARALALSCCTAPASAAVRLLGLDPLASQATLVRLAPAVDALAADCARIAATTPIAQWPSGAAPALDLLADVHLTAEVRLFAS